MNTIKYKITITASVIVLFSSIWILNFSYHQHIELLNEGDKTGEKLQMRELIYDHNKK